MRNTWNEEVFGIECEHHYGITTHELVEGEEAYDTVYRLIRDVWHKFKPEREINVLDDNHTWVIEDSPSAAWAAVCIIKNEKSPYFHNILGLPSWNFDDGPGATWFRQPYRIATRESIDEEISSHLNWKAYWLEQAPKHKDTIKGRKAKERNLESARCEDRTIRLIERRWPQYLGTAEQAA